MDNLFSANSDSEIARAKARVWNRMQKKMPERGLSPYQSAVSALRGMADGMEDSRLKRAVAKERIMDLLPDREPAMVPFYKRADFGWSSLKAFEFSRRMVAVPVLAVFMAFFMVPVLQLEQVASAAVYNTIEVVQGEALLNGVPTSGSTFLQSGDEIVTGEGSMVHVTFVDDSRITLGPNTEVAVPHVQIDPGNKAKTEVVVDVIEGRVWSQVINLLGNESYFLLRFPDGEVFVDQRASFDTQVEEYMIVESVDGLRDTSVMTAQTEIQVVKNLVDVQVAKGDEVYEGTIGQGVSMFVAEDMSTEETEVTAEEDVWWNFNSAYGKTYARQVDECYAHDRIAQVKILPGNPLYFFKSFGETVTETLAITDSAKQEVIAEHANNRLTEAQALLEQGDMETATEVLEDYQDMVDESMQNSGNEVMLAKLDEVKKELMSRQDLDAGTELLEAHVNETVVKVSASSEAKNDAKILSASQKLQMVPDLIEAGDLEKVMAYLETYQAEAKSILVQLEGVSLEARETLVSALLEQKMNDLQLLRVISSMVEDTEYASEDTEDTADLLADSQVFGELSMMVLSLRERALDRLADFFDSTEYDLEEQYDVYSRLKDASDMSEGLQQQFDDVEDSINATTGANEKDTVVEIETVPFDDVFPIDPRF